MDKISDSQENSLQSAISKASNDVIENLSFENQLNNTQFLKLPENSNTNAKSGWKSTSISALNIDYKIKRAVDEAVKAWNKNEELRNLYKPLGVSQYSLPGNGNVGRLLQIIHQKRQLIHFIPPKQPDRMVCHAVLNANDYYNSPTRKFIPRQTILVNTGFFSDHTSSAAGFVNATAKEITSITPDQMRALLLLHEAKHLYTLMGHLTDPSTHDWIWNDYILWTGFLGLTVARQV